VRGPDPAAGKPAPAPAVRLLRLRHGGMPWALAAESVREVVGTERLQRHPRATAGAPYGWLLGEGEEVPVFLLAGERLATGTGAVVVVQLPAGPDCGLAVEAVEEVREEPMSRLRLLPALAAARRWVFPRVVLWDDGLALEIAPEAVPYLAGTAAHEEARRQRPTLAPPAGTPRFEVPPPRSSSSAGLCFFTLPGLPALGFALPAAQVVEVMSSFTIRPVPGVPEPFLGLHAWRGEPLPVLDLARALGIPPAAPRAKRFAHGLVARAAHSQQLLVFPLESMTGVRQGPFPYPPAGASPFPGARHVLGSFANGEQPLVVPDLDGLLRTSPAATAVPTAASGGIP